MAVRANVADALVGYVLRVGWSTVGVAGDCVYCAIGVDYDVTCVVITVSYRIVIVRKLVADDGYDSVAVVVE